MYSRRQMCAFACGIGLFGRVCMTGSMDASVYRQYGCRLGGWLRSQAAIACIRGRQALKNIRYASQK